MILAASPIRNIPFSVFEGWYKKNFLLLQQTMFSCYYQQIQLVLITYRVLYYRNILHEYELISFNYCLQYPMLTIGGLHKKRFRLMH